MQHAALAIEPPLSNQTDSPAILLGIAPFGPRSRRAVSNSFVQLLEGQSPLFRTHAYAFAKCQLRLYRQHK